MCLGMKREESMAEKWHGVAAGICFEGGSVARGKRKRRRGPCGRVRVEEGEGGEGGPWRNGQHRGVGSNGPRPSGAGGAVAM
jgi:hypothetical protein